MAVRVDDQTDVTAVAFVRQLPPETSESELEELGAPFGNVRGVLVIGGKSMGFIEFDSAEDCRKAIEYYQWQPATIRGNTVEMKKSSRNKVARKAVSSGLVLLVTVGHSQKDASPPHLDSLPDTLYIFFSSATPSRVARIVCFEKNGQTQGLVEFVTPEDAQLASSKLEGHPLPSAHPIKIQPATTVAPLWINQSNTKSRDFSHLCRGDALPAIPEPPSAPEATSSQSTEGSILLVSRLPTSITPDHIFMLFSTCGDVMKVKILYTKRDTALVQFRDASQAQAGRQNLNGVPLYGSKLLVTTSKQKDVNMPQIGSSREAYLLTKDFTDSIHHRFRVPNSKNFKHIVRPCHVLHVSNVPDGASDTEMSDLFSSVGKCVYTSFKNDKRMGLATMETVDAAVTALIQLHGTAVGGHPSSKLHIAFSDYRTRTGPSSASTESPSTQQQPPSQPLPQPALFHPSPQQYHQPQHLHHHNHVHLHHHHHQQHHHHHHQHQHHHQQHHQHQHQHQHQQHQHQHHQHQHHHQHHQQQPLHQLAPHLHQQQQTKSAPPSWIGQEPAHQQQTQVCTYGDALLRGGA
ncbi:Polypyrimidine tract-binding protein-like protein 3 [Diplonema papillatum]|nr:Polypyrimidine tract-binding protein-like protein 3 [Diplonema papillatum]